MGVMFNAAKKYTPSLPKFKSAYKEGVFKTPRGKWIARIKIRGWRAGNYRIISMHDTEMEATQAYEQWYRDNA